MLRPLLLVLVLPALTLALPPPSAAVAGIIQALHAKLYARCVFLLRGQDESRLGAEVSRMLWAANISSSVIGFDDLGPSRPRIFCDTRPLLVLLRRDSAARGRLRQLSERGLTGPTEGGRPVWLAFPEDEEDFFSGVNVPFDCQFVVAQERAGGYLLAEVYRVAEAFPLETVPLGNWTGGAFEMSPGEFYDRRNNLSGVVIKTATKHHPPFTLVLAEGGNVTVGGFFGQVWHALERQMNFSTEYAVQEPGGESNDAMPRLVADNDAQFGIVDSTVRADRLATVDFTIPLMFTSYRVFIQHPGYKFLSWTSFLEPFRVDLWITELCCMLTLAALLSAFHYCTRHFGDERLEEPHTYTLYNSLFYMFGVFCMQGHDITPRSCSCRVVYLVGYLTAIVLMAAYSAALISYLTVQASSLPFTDVEGLLRDRSYRFGMVRNSTAQHMVQISSDRTLAWLGRDASLQSARPSSQLQGLQMVCDQRFAFLIPMDYAILFNENVTCDIVALPGFAIKVGVAMMVEKHNPYKGLVNHNINRMRKSGTLQKLLNDARPKRLPKVPNDLTSVDLWDVAPILLALVIGAAGAFVILAVERRLRKLLEKSRLQKNANKLFLAYMR